MLSLVLSAIERFDHSAGLQQAIVGMALEGESVREKQALLRESGRRKQFIRKEKKSKLVASGVTPG